MFSGLLRCNLATRHPDDRQLLHRSFSCAKKKSCNLATRAKLLFVLFLGPLQCFWTEVAVLTNGWIICRFGEISEVSGDFLLDFAVDMFLEEFP